MSHLIKIYAVCKFRYFHLWYLKSKILDVPCLICQRVTTYKTVALSNLYFICCNRLDSVELYCTALYCIIMYMHICWSGNVVSIYVSQIFSRSSYEVNYRFVSCVNTSNSEIVKH